MIGTGSLPGAATTTLDPDTPNRPPARAGQSAATSKPQGSGAADVSEAVETDWGAVEPLVGSDTPALLPLPSVGVGPGCFVRTGVAVSVLLGSAVGVPGVDGPGSEADSDSRVGAAGAERVASTTPTIVAATRATTTAIVGSRCVRTNDHMRLIIRTECLCHRRMHSSPSGLVDRRWERVTTPVAKRHFRRGSAGERCLQVPGWSRGLRGGMSCLSCCRAIWT